MHQHHHTTLRAIKGVSRPQPSLLIGELKMTSIASSNQNFFFDAGLLTDTISQFVALHQPDQQPKPEHPQTDPNTFSFNGAEFQAHKPRNSLIPFPRIG
ncbi:hypothetical protein [Pseudomonas proteolytica]